MKVLVIAAGGGAGALLRYGLAGWAQGLTHGAFPVGTAVVNVLGCLLIGFFGVALAGPLAVREEIRLAVLVGLLGGFTTFSTFGFETLLLLNDGQWRPALANVLLSNCLGLIAAWGGYRLAERVYGV
ncbi:MAG: fluoride efflux transporter CrcB [Phycisphaerae bacterium]|nr:fluoride efflux transporter CrcB [Phycisphaerae bacterium]